MHGMYKRPILLALLLLALAVGAELVGPFLAKRMIDTNIMGIQKPWYEAKAGESYAVPYDGAGTSGRTIGRTARSRGREVRVLQVRANVLLRRRGARAGSRSADVRETGR